MLTPLGFEGDGHAHPSIHGGPLKAVLLIAAEVIEQLKTLGFAVYPGALGENLTTEGLDYRQIRPGQRFRAGPAAFFEITRIRVPCSTLDVYNTSGMNIQNAIYDARVRAGDATSPRWGMSGFYARVIDPGVVRTKDIIALTDQAV